MIGKLSQTFIDEFMENISNKQGNDINIYDFVNNNATAALMIGLDISYVARTCAAMGMSSKKADIIFDNVVEDINYILKSVSDYNDIFLKYIPILKKEMENHPRTTSIRAIAEFFTAAYTKERCESESKQFYRFMISLGIILANLFDTGTSKVIKINFDNLEA